MARDAGIATQNNFVKGLVTEASGLNFPENACTDTDNCVFDNIGNVSWRRGFNFEANNSTYTQDLTGCAVVSYLWKGAGGDGDISFVVAQTGETLHFYRVTGNNALSQQKHATTIDLMDFAPTGVDSVSTLECQFSAGNGVLFVVNQRLNSFYVSYDSELDNFSTSTIEIKIRDFEGDTTDSLEVNQRPTSTVAQLSAAHKYNLYNQGWDANSLAKWDTARTDMPSNSDVSWYFKNTNDTFDFKNKVLDKVLGNSPATKGHFIYNLYNMDRSTNISGAQDDVIELNRVSTVAFFAGRVFYSGLKTPKRGSQIYFTQVIESSSQYGKCHQINDPTSEQLSDALPTDGGVIDLLEAGTVLRMFPLLNTLLVFATNGIWAITGSQGLGFTAVDFSVIRVSAVPNVNANSFVDVEGIPYWWNFDGIYRLNPQQNQFEAASLTKETIQSFYNDIPIDSKVSARGFYDPVNKRVSWLYKSDLATSFEDRYVFDKVLNLNLVTGAFFPWTVSKENVKIHSAVNISSLGSVASEEPVEDSGIQVTDSGEDVVVFLATTTTGSFTTKYLVSYEENGLHKITFAGVLNDNRVDWEDYDDEGEDFESFFDAGYVVRGQGIRKFQSNYLQVFADAEASSSFRIRGMWNFAISGDSGKWGTSQTFYVNETNFNRKPIRIKLRGRGIVLQYRIYNNANYPCTIFGWSAFDTGNKQV